VTVSDNENVITHSLFQFGSHRLDSHNIHTIKSENLGPCYTGKFSFESD